VEPPRRGAGDPRGDGPVRGRRRASVPPDAPARGALGLRHPEPGRRRRRCLRLDGLCGTSVRERGRHRIRLRRGRCLRRRRRLLRLRLRGRRTGAARLAADSHGRRRRRRGWRDRSDGKQRERIDVALFVLRRPDAEMDVRHAELGRSARPDRSHGRGFVDTRAGARPDRAEMRERDGVPVPGPDAERQPVTGRGARKCDDSSRGRENVTAGVAADVDPAVLPGGVWMRAVEGECPQDDPVGRPGPGRSARREHSREQDQAEGEEPQGPPPCCQT